MGALTSEILKGISPIVTRRSGARCDWDVILLHCCPTAGQAAEQCGRQAANL